MAFAALIVKFQDRRLRLLWPLFTALIGLSVAVFAFLVWKRHELHETKRNGETIVRALETFHTDHGFYPESLSELTPTCISEIPPARRGEALWIYHREEGGFSLQANEDERTGDGNSHWLEYNTTWRNWERGD